MCDISLTHIRPRVGHRRESDARHGMGICEKQIKKRLTRSSKWSEVCLVAIRPNTLVRKLQEVRCREFNFQVHESGLKGKSDNFVAAPDNHRKIKLNKPPSRNQRKLEIIKELLVNSWKIIIPLFLKCFYAHLSYSYKY